MSIQSILSGESSNVYQAAAKQKTEESQAQSKVKTEESSQSVQAAQVDEYDPNDPVGAPAEGIYSVERDEEGNLKIDYTEPRSQKTAQAAASSESLSAGTGAEDSNKSAGNASQQTAGMARQGQGAAPAGGAGGASGAGSNSSASSDDDDDDDEIEELKQQRQQLQQQIARETDELRKARLQSQLQQIESQIIMKSGSVSA